MNFYIGFWAILTVIEILSLFAMIPWHQPIFEIYRYVAGFYLLMLLMFRPNGGKSHVPLWMYILYLIVCWIPILNVFVFIGLNATFMDQDYKNPFEMMPHLEKPCLFLEKCFKYIGKFFSTGIGI